MAFEFHISAHIKVDFQAIDLDLKLVFIHIIDSINVIRHTMRVLLQNV